MTTKTIGYQKLSKEFITIILGIIISLAYLLSLFKPIEFQQSLTYNEKSSYHSTNTSKNFSHIPKKATFSKALWEDDTTAIYSRAQEKLDELTCSVLKSFIPYLQPHVKPTFGNALYNYSISSSSLEPKASYYHLRISVLSSLPHPPTKLFLHY